MLDRALIKQGKSWQHIDECHLSSKKAGKNSRLSLTTWVGKPSQGHQFRDVPNHDGILSKLKGKGE